MHARIHNSQVVEYPIINLRQRLADVSLPADLTDSAELPDGFVYVHQVPAEDFDPTSHKLIAAQPVLVDRAWQAGYQVVPLDETELDELRDRKAMEVRHQRDRLLTATDWTQGKDIPDAVSAPWVAYRQALRDVPQQAGFPLSINWPVSPAQQ